MAFPTTLDNFSEQATGEIIFATDINELQTAIEALEAKVGIDGSAVTSSIDFLLKDTSGGHDHDGSDSKALPASAITAHASRHTSGGADPVDHGTLAGLGDDDHTQYTLLAGRSGGQTVIGGTAASENLTLQSTAHATRGKILLGANSAYDEVNKRLGLGTQSPANPLHIVDASSLDAVLIEKSAGSGNQGLVIKQTGGSWVPIVSLIGDRNIASMNVQYLGEVYSGTGANSGTLFRGRASRGSLASPSALASGDVMFRLIGEGGDGSVFGGGAEIKMTALEAFGGSAKGTKLELLTTNVGATTPTLKLAIVGDNVGIGVSSPSHRLEASLTTALDAYAVGQFNLTSNNSSALSGVVLGLGLSLTDQATANRLSYSGLRISYDRQTGATGIGTAFDTLMDVGASFGASHSGIFVGLRLEPPTVASGITVNEYSQIRMHAATGAGTVTTKKGVMFEGTFTYVLDIAQTDTNTAGAYHGKIPILYGGVLKYLHVFS